MCVFTPSGKGLAHGVKCHHIVQRRTNIQRHVLIEQGRFKRDELFENEKKIESILSSSASPAAGPESRICVQAVHEGGDQRRNGGSRLGVREEARWPCLNPQGSSNVSTPNRCPHEKSGRRAFKCSPHCVTGYRLP